MIQMIAEVQCMSMKKGMKISSRYLTVGVVLQSYLLHASMYAERGVGEYGIRFSHFCGPVASNSESLSDPVFLQFSFGMNAVRLRAIHPKSSTEESLQYHISRGKLHSQSRSKATCYGMLF